MPNHQPPPADLPPLERLRRVVHLLRAPGGCPWDREQTHESLVPNLLEEAYETAEAIRAGDRPHMREELGDLLLQVVLHSEIASESAAFDLDGVASEITGKLIRRHPHVFADSEAGDSESVLKQWDAIKRAEKGAETAPHLEGITRGLPSLIRATKIQKRAAKVGFDWDAVVDVLPKIREEIAEVEEALGTGDGDHLAEEIGDLLFAVVNLARKAKIDAEAALAAANEKFVERFHRMEDALAGDGRSLDEASIEEMEAAWQAAKVAGC